MGADTCLTGHTHPGAVVTVAESGVGAPRRSSDSISVRSQRGLGSPCVCAFLDKSIPNSKKKGLVLLFELVVQKALWLCVVFGPRWAACMVCRVSWFRCLAFLPA